MADETFGGVIIEGTEPQVLVAIVQGRAQSGYSGYSGSGGGGTGGSGFCGASGFSGKSGWSGGSGGSGFSGFSSRSGYSGYSGVIGTSGFSGYSGASGTSGAGGGNSGYSGYSGLDGTFSASGYSGYSGFSSRSGFSGYSGSGISGFSAYSGYSGQSISGFSGYCGPSGFSGFSSSGFSGFSGFSGRSGFSGGPSGFSGFSGTGSPSGGAVGDAQFNDGAAGFAGDPGLNNSGGVIRAKTSNWVFQDSSDTSKQLQVSLAQLPTSTLVNLVVGGAGGNPVAPSPSAATANQFVTGISTTGVITKAQPSFTNLSGLVTYGQLDRSTSVVAETATLTIAANTKVKSTASGTMTAIAFSGGDNAQQGRRLDLDITGGPYTINIPACRRLGETGTITTLQIFAGYNEFSWEYINGEYVLSDSVSVPSTGGGTSGYSGASGRSGYSAFSGFSGPSGTGSSGFSGYSGFAASSSGFSGFSAPNILSFSNRNDIDYTLTLSDANTGIKMTSGSPHTLTIPTNTAVPFIVGTQIPVEQGGLGLVTIAAAVGVTIQGTNATSGQYSVVVLIKQALDTWLVARSGVSGYSGYSGGTGSSGGSGFSGFSGGGPSGFSGFSGPGSSGFSGFSGFSGRSGYSAYSGYSGPQLLTFSTQTDVSYTLVLGDANTGVKMVSASTRTLTVPANATVAFAIGTQIPIEQGGAGPVLIAAAGGVTLQGASGTSGQYSMVVLIKQATDTWLVASGNSGYSGYSGGAGAAGASGYSAFSGFSGTFGFTRLTVSGSDVTNTTQSFVDITGLVTPSLTAATLYYIRAVLFVSTSAVTTGVRYAIGVTGSGTSSTVNALASGTTLTTNASSETINSANTATTNTYLTTASTSGTIEFRGWVRTTGTGPTAISIQHLKVTSGTSTVKIGSYLEYRIA